MANTRTDYGGSMALKEQPPSILEEAEQFVSNVAVEDLITTLYMGDFPAAIAELKRLDPVGKKDHEEAWIRKQEKKGKKK